MNRSRSELRNHRERIIRNRLSMIKNAQFFMDSVWPYDQLGRIEKAGRTFTAWVRGQRDHRRYDRTQAKRQMLRELAEQ